MEREEEGEKKKGIKDDPKLALKSPFFFFTNWVSKNVIESNEK